MHKKAPNGDNIRSPLCVWDGRRCQNLAAEQSVTSGPSVPNSMAVQDVRSAWIVLWNHGDAGLAAGSSFGIKTARLRRRPEGLKSEAEHVSECVWEAQASAVQCVCVCVSSCSLSYASSVVCRRSRWQLRAGWNKAPVGIMHGAPSVPQKKNILEQMENAAKRSPFGSNGWFWIWNTKHVIPSFCLPLSAMKLLTG